MKDLADFRFLVESPSGWFQEPPKALIREIRMNPRNVFYRKNNPFNQLNLWLEKSCKMLKNNGFNACVFRKKVVTL